MKFCMFNGIILSLVVILSTQDASAGLFRSPEARKSNVVERAIDQVYPALVRIQVVSLEAGRGRLQRSQVSGSGVIISPEGHVVTNHHVAGKAHMLICRMPDGEEIEATLVGADAMTDIAIIQLNLEKRKENKPLPVARFGDSDEVKVGDTVMALGSPAGLTQSVMLGIVSNAAMMLPGQGSRFRLDGEQVGLLVRWIGHDARIYSGNSGGPLINTRGEIIGINEVNIGNLGGAIPGNLAKDIAAQLIESGTVKRSWTGLECQPRLKNSKYESGVLVSGVIADSPAECAGVRPGDVIVEYDGEKVNAEIKEQMPLFNRLELSAPIGRRILVKAWRGDELKAFEFETVPRERARGEDQELKSWGMTARDFTLMSALENKRDNKDGAQVHTVRSGGPINEAKPKIKSGDVILEVDGKPVNSVAELRTLTEEITAGQDERVPVVVRFHRGTLDMLTVVKVGKDPESDRPALSRKAWLPVETQVLTRELARALDLNGKSGVRVVKLQKNHSAEKAGMQVGDILLKLDGEEIPASQPEDSEVLDALIRQYRIGSEVEFDVVRNGEKLKLSVELEEPMTPVSDLDRYEDDFFEMTVRQMNMKDLSDRKLEEDTRGVLIDRVENAGWAALGGLRQNDLLYAINNQKVEHPDDVERILKQARQDQLRSVVFFVQRGIHTLFLEVEPSYDIKVD